MSEMDPHLAPWPWMGKRTSLPVRIVRKVEKFVGWLERLTYKRVVIVFNPRFISRAQIERFPDWRLRINAAFIVIHDDSISWQIWDIDHLSRKQFAELKALIEANKEKADGVEN